MLLLFNYSTSEIINLKEKNIYLYNSIYLPATLQTMSVTT